MTYNEALAKSLTVKWKTIPCSSSGEECWCRIILPIDEIKDDQENEIYIVGSGSINKEYAEHIVKIHNEYIDKINGRLV